MNEAKTPFLDTTTRLLKISLLLISFPVLGNDSDRAMRSVQRAVLQLEPVRAQRKKLEKTIKKSLNAPVWLTTVIGVGASAGLSKRVSTRRLKNLRLKGENWNLRPELIHEFGGQTSGRLQFEMDF